MSLARIDGRVARTGQSDPAPVRAYDCLSCGGWHVTSQPKEQR
jgi:ATP-dependent DNA ligase